MSRVGREPILIPEGVEVEVKNGTLKVKGSLGELERAFPDVLKVEIKEGKILVSKKREGKSARSLHGLWRTLIANMVQGVKEGFEKELEIQGPGYRARLEGKDLVLKVGFSHPPKVTPPEGIEFKVPKSTEIKVKGIDKELVGRVAAEIRVLKPPDAYKGKGIRYKGEEVKLKPGKRAEYMEEFEK